jgi:hypothetical protein
MYVGAGSKAYVTLRGGGMYVVDTQATPMRVLRSYGNDQIAPAGCGGTESRGRVYINSGSATESMLYVFDVATDNLLSSVPTTSWGTDAHGTLVLGGRYLWMPHRGAGDNILVLDTTSGQVVTTIDDVGQGPDLLDVNPAGDLVFVSLRGPKALTGGPAAVGETPGMAIMAVEQGGAGGHRVAFIPIGDQGPESDVDPHGIAVRWVGGRAPSQ